MTTPPSTATTFSRSSATTGYCRVTVVATGSRIDVALPEDVPVADLYPEVQRLTGQAPGEGELVGHHLVRRDGSVLDSARTLLGLGVTDGEVLTLRPFARSLPPVVFDDVSDAVASAVTRDRTLWNDRYLRISGLVGAVALMSLMALVLWFADSADRDMHGLPGVVAAVAAVLLLVLAPVRARFYDDPGSATALGLAALPHAALAGSALLPLQEGHGVGRLQFLLACAAVLVAAVVMISAMPGNDALFVGAAVLGTTGVLATFGAILGDGSALAAASVCAPVAIGVLAFLPGMSARFARLPIGYAAPRSGYDSSDNSEEDPFAPADPGPIDAERIAAQARRGHEVLIGLVGGFSAVVVGSAAVLGFSGNLWAQLLALASGLALLMRARLFRYSAQVACAMVAGATALTLLVVGLVLNSTELLGGSQGSGLRTLWLSAALAAGALLLMAIALIVPRSGLTPFWGRLLDIVEIAVLLSLTPLCLAVLDVYTSARALTSG
ncbi:type VII secretion integral membrane protein EccD [Streptomyces sp. XM4193]|uniref:type VII secretion integral membrane protein EccD n=1 Tax=Streptomyces sp. XM4193 TaxID=2929782 RepID=UPI001FF8A525|nr:type VII secretion integral membrane protein EccD [Streptomyces sp. XM4193]MCK1797201.1 type VII secretion integral membrane protein EccD [Streptomyces sp. XM4193]